MLWRKKKEKNVYPCKPQFYYIKCICQISQNCRFGFILYNIFGEGSNNVHLYEWLANLIMIQKEHWDDNTISLQNVQGQRESVDTRNAQ